MLALVKKPHTELSIHGEQEAKHDWYANHSDGEMQAVPRHREINEDLARAIIKILKIGRAHV